MISDKIRQCIENHIKAKIISDNSVGGGCIADSRVIKSETGQQFFLKSGYSGNMFHKEANGLIELSKPKAFRVPKVELIDNNFLLLEYIPTGSKNSNFFEIFGTQLAKLHKYTSESFGFYEDNFIGTTPQINIATTPYANNWKDFYYHHRLLFQFRLAESNGYVTRDIRDAFSELSSKINEILSGSEEPPTLMHGDLWGGNYMVDENGEPVLIDPAVYYGHREADLAMTKIFGGFSPEFYEAYQKEFPLRNGYEYREPLYKLYHIFNHLNLFGRGYYNEVIQLMRFYL